MTGNCSFEEVVGEWKEKWASAVATYLDKYLGKPALALNFTGYEDGEYQQCSLITLTVMSACAQDMKTIYAFEGLSKAMNPRTGGGIVRYKKVFDIVFVVPMLSVGHAWKFKGQPVSY